MDGELIGMGAMGMVMVRREGEGGGEGVVLLQPARSQVPHGNAHQSRHGEGVLEGHGQGP